MICGAASCFRLRLQCNVWLVSPSLNNNTKHNYRDRAIFLMRKSRDRCEMFPLLQWQRALTLGEQDVSRNILLFSDNTNDSMYG